MKSVIWEYHICAECKRYRESPEGDAYCLCDDGEETRGTHDGFEEACKYFEKANNES